MRFRLKFLLVILVALQSNQSMAQNIDQETSGYYDASAPVHEQASITWPILPGESVEDLAALFYPHNKAMQQRFVVKTLQLSRGINPSLDPADKASQANLIIIPNIKVLAKKTGYIKPASFVRKVKPPSAMPTLIKTYSIEQEDTFEISAKIQAIYDDIVKRNAQFKQDLLKLNLKLTGLQQKLNGLKTELSNLLDKALDFTTAKKSAVAPQKQMRQTGSQIELKSKSIPATAHTVIEQTLHPEKTSRPDRISDESRKWFLWALLSLLFLAFNSVIGVYIYRKMHRQQASPAEGPEETAPTENQSLAEQVTVNSHSIDAPIPQEEFSGSIPHTEPETVIDPQKQEEIELVLEQAKIYLSIDRVKEAIMLLKTQIQETPKAALHLWLCLLDIYRKHNQKEEFLSEAKEFHENFNIMMPQWEKSRFPVLAASSLEELPHIVDKLTKLWTTESKTADNMTETRSYLDELLLDNRNTERTGFGSEVFHEILLLRDILDERFKLSQA